MFFLKLVVTFTLFLSYESLRAEEPAAESASDEANYSGKQDQTWEVVQTKLGAMKTKLDSQTAVINSLIAEKASLSNGDEVAKKNEELKKQHAKFEEMVGDYNRLNDEYLTKFPERGTKEKRVYQRLKMKTLDSFEDDYTLRGRLNKLHSKVLRQYPGSVAPPIVKKTKKTDPKPASATQVQGNDVTDQIELKK